MCEFKNNGIAGNQNLRDKRQKINKPVSALFILVFPYFEEGKHLIFTEGMNGTGVRNCELKVQNIHGIKGLIL